MHYLYRSTETDDEGDPIDFGMVVAKGQAEAIALIKARFESLGQPGCEFRLYPQQAPAGAGLFTSAGTPKTVR